MESEEVVMGGVNVLKVIEKETKVGVNVCFNFVEGYNSMEIIKIALEEYTQLKCLLLPIKAYLKERMLNSSDKGGVGSYLLMVMIIGYLQYQSKLTDLKTMNLGELFIEFFEFYGSKFNHEMLGISVIGRGSFYKRGGETKGISVENPLNPKIDLGDPVRCYNDIVKSIQYAYDALKYNNGSLTDLIHSYPNRKRT
jgi:non-canonical poly(A) RNA polymerase PAPD5/7